MKFGIALQPSYGRFMLTPTLADVAQRASELGYHSLWTTDQLTDRSGTASSTEPLVTIASLLHVVPDMQLGVAVVVLPYRNAVVLAKQAASLSLLSEGRFALGIGVGGSEAECIQLNVDFTSRGQKADESIEVMRRLWREEAVSIDGRFHRLADLGMQPNPPGDRVPLWIGGRSEAAIRRTARVGDAWVPALVSPSILAAGVAQLRDLCVGRAMPTIAAMELVHPHGTPAQEGNEGPPVHIAGSAEEMVSTVRQYEQAGLEHLICSFNVHSQDELMRQMRTVSEEIMPHFAVQ